MQQLRAALYSLKIAVPTLMEAHNSHPKLTGQLAARRGRAGRVAHSLGVLAAVPPAPKSAEAELRALLHQVDGCRAKAVEQMSGGVRPRTSWQGRWSRTGRLRQDWG